jgi:hypothetical protein
VSDCTEALRHKPNWVKALARRAKAWEETDRHFDALEGTVFASLFSPALPNSLISSLVYQLK